MGDFLAWCVLDFSPTENFLYDYPLEPTEQQLAHLCTPVWLEKVSGCILEMLVQLLDHFPDKHL